MKKNRDIRNQKIIIFYIIAIVFPSVILGVLAFRGIRNDQALMEKEQLKDLNEISTQISDKISNELNTLEKIFRPLILSIPVPDNLIFRDTSLTSALVNNQPVLSIFHIENNQLSISDNRVLYVPDEISASYSLPKTPSPISLEQAWNYEFRAKNYSGAIRYYRKELGKTTDIQTKAMILNSIARNQKKNGNWEDAVKTYQQIYNECEKVYLGNGIPIGTVSLMESGKIYFENNHIDSSLLAINHLIKDLHSFKWKISESFYSNTITDITKISEEIAELEIKDETLNLLEDENKALLDSLSIIADYNSYLLAFLKTGGNLISRPSNDDMPTNVSHYLADGQSYLFSMFREKEDWGLLFSRELLLNELVLPIMNSLQKGNNINWEISDFKGEIAGQSIQFNDSEISHSFGFPASNPYWEIKLYAGERSLIASFLSSGSGVFLYIFILIIVLLAFGLFFTLKTVRSELQLAKMKSFFITTVSHEFKSPLASIRQLAEMLDQDRVPDEKRKKVYYSGILQQSERLSHLIENILNFSRMEEGRKEFHFEKADIVQPLKDVILAFETLMASRGYEFHLTLDDNIPEIYFDRDSMEQVFNNLIDNACKYSENSKKIDISAYNRKGSVVIDVRDYGMGINKNDQDEIFSRFYRAGDVLTQKIKGTGIGLTIVKQIINAHNGKIEVESDPGKGSTFSVILPVTLNKPE